MIASISPLSLSCFNPRDAISSSTLPCEPPWTENFSAFDSRNYDYGKFSDLIKTIGLFEVDTQKQRIKDKRKK